MPVCRFLNSAHSPLSYFIRYFLWSDSQVAVLNVAVVQIKPVVMGIKYPFALNQFQTHEIQHIKEPEIYCILRYCCRCCSECDIFTCHPGDGCQTLSLAVHLPLRQHLVDSARGKFAPIIPSGTSSDRFVLMTQFGGQTLCVGYEIEHFVSNGTWDAWFLIGGQY